MDRWGDKKSWSITKKKLKCKWRLTLQVASPLFLPFECYPQIRQISVILRQKQFVFAWLNLSFVDYRIQKIRFCDKSYTGKYVAIRWRKSRKRRTVWSATDMTSRRCVPSTSWRLGGKEWDGVEWLFGDAESLKRVPSKNQTRALWAQHTWFKWSARQQAWQKPHNDSDHLTPGWLKAEGCRFMFVNRGYVKPFETFLWLSAL